MRTILILPVMLCFLVAAAASAADFVVVVNKASALTTVSPSELKRLYTGKVTDIGGKKAVPANLSLDNKAAIGFLKDVLGTTPVDYKSFWLAEQVRGGSSAPTVQKTSDAMVAFVSENPDAIGYVEATTATDKVKVVTVK
jgi:ABC-type phosphate transport system substrate-binding protein